MPQKWDALSPAQDGAGCQRRLEEDRVKFMLGLDARSASVDASRPSRDQAGECAFRYCSDRFAAERRQKRTSGSPASCAGRTVERDLLAVVREPRPGFHVIVVGEPNASAARDARDVDSTRPLSSSATNVTILPSNRERRIESPSVGPTITTGSSVRRCARRSASATSWGQKRHATRATASGQHGVQPPRDSSPRRRALARAAASATPVRLDGFEGAARNLSRPAGSAGGGFFARQREDDPRKRGRDMRRGAAAGAARMMAEVRSN